MRERFLSAFAESRRLIDVSVADADLVESLSKAASLVADCLRAGGKVMVCGNGGSLADAVHFAEEFTGRFRNDRAPLSVMALADASHITCTANDYGFEHIFERPVRAFGRQGDVLLLLSTSGKSPNLVLAVRAANDLGASTIGFLGRGGGDLLPLCLVAANFPGETSDRIQEMHMLALHALIESVEESLGV